MSPEGAATYAAYRQSLSDGRIRSEESVVLFNCASGLKYELPRADATLDKDQPVDYAALLAAP